MALHPVFVYLHVSAALNFKRLHRKPGRQLNPRLALNIEPRTTGGTRRTKTHG